MKFHILTLFPDALESYLSSSIIGRSIQENKIEVNLVNFRDFSESKHKRVDDTTYGGGPGMVLQCDPLYKAIESIKTNFKTNNNRVVFLSPGGQSYSQKKAVELSALDELVLVCGFYEGFDARIFKLFEHEIISIGDYILTNGGLASLVLVDSIARIKSEVLLNESSLDEESFSDGLLEYDQYSKPEEYMGLKVPEILLSGHHKKIEEFRRKSSISNTLKYRPELLEQANLKNNDIEYIFDYLEEQNHDYK